MLDGPDYSNNRGVAAISSGLLLATDRLDDKTVIHNYGHGGNGMTTSWGHGFLAADLAIAHTERRAAVIGCASSG